MTEAEREILKNMIENCKEEADRLLRELLGEEEQEEFLPDEIVWDRADGNYKEEFMAKYPEHLLPVCFIPTIAARIPEACVARLYESGNIEFYDKFLDRICTLPTNITGKYQEWQLR